jgi:hypothetical protein
MSFVIITKHNGGHALFVNGFHMPDFVVNKQTTSMIQSWLDKGSLTIYSEHEYGNIVTPTEEQQPIDADSEAQQQEAEELINKFLSLISTDTSEG